MRLIDAEAVLYGSALFAHTYLFQCLNFTIIYILWRINRNGFAVIFKSGMLPIAFALLTAVKLELQECGSSCSLSTLVL